MGTVITVINQKGGVGKSTTADAIGSYLVSKKKKVLFIDLDPQGNLSYALGNDNELCSVEDVLLDGVAITDAIQKNNRGEFIASGPRLSGVDIEFATKIGKEYVLKECLDQIKELYDFIVIDTPPSLGTLTINALTASDGVVIPAQADVYSLQGIGQLNNTIAAVRKFCNPNLKIYGILLTRFNSRANISRDIAEELDSIADMLETSLYKTKIRECTAIKEAQVNRESIFEYAKKSNASVDYADFGKELLKEVKNGREKEKDF